MELPLPSPEEVIQDSFDLAWPQVLAYSSALTGVLIVVMILKSFTR